MLLDYLGNPKYFRRRDSPMGRTNHQQHGKRQTNRSDRRRLTFREALLNANRRAEEKTNRRCERRDGKSIWAAVAAESSNRPVFEIDSGIVRRCLQWALGILLLPVCWVTMRTLLWRFWEKTSESFWLGADLWSFSIGALLMAGWFFSAVAQRFFLYLYVLGHELTHAIFVMACLGRVSDFHVSAGGGYITTNKSNILIALSPYFVPFWAVVAAAAYFISSLFFVLPETVDLWFYGIMGATWVFHLLWTLWMLPRDQPDLRENGTFLSLTFILLANMLVLAAILCFTSEHPWMMAKDFLGEWLKNAVIFGDFLLRTMESLAAHLRKTL